MVNNSYSFNEKHCHTKYYYTISCTCTSTLIHILLHTRNSPHLKSQSLEKKNTKQFSKVPQLPQLMTFLNINMKIFDKQTTRWMTIDVGIYFS